MEPAPSESAVVAVPARSSSGFAPRIAWAAFWAGLGLRVLQLWLATHPSPERAFIAFGVGPLAVGASAIFGLSASAVGVVIATRVPGNRFGALWVAVGLAQGILATLLLVGAEHAGSSDLGVLAGVIASAGVAQAPFAATALGLLTFPTGTLLSRRWRWLAGFVIGAVLWRGVEAAFGSDEVYLLPLLPNPLRLDGPLGDVIHLSEQLRLGVGLVFVSVSLCLGGVVARYRRADVVGRRQIRWFLLGAAAYVLTLVPAAYVLIAVGTLDREAGPLFALNFLGFSLLPVTTLVAITRYRLYEIDRIVNRTVLYGALTAILAGIFTAGIAFAQRLFIALTGEASDAAIVMTTLVVATLYAPLRKRLEAIVDRRLKYDSAVLGAYRDELERYLALAEPRAAAERLVREAVRNLELAGAAILDGAGRPLATAGSWPLDADLVIPLPGFGPGAALAVGRRSDQRQLEAAIVAELKAVADFASRAVAASGGSARRG